MEFSKQRIEAVVDAVAEVLGHEVRMSDGTPTKKHERACEAALKALLPRNTAYIGVVDNAIQAHLFHCGEAAEEASKALLHSKDELIEWCRKWDVDNFMCSSSIDFPEDSTDNQEIIDLCNELRS